MSLLLLSTIVDWSASSSFQLITQVFGSDNSHRFSALWYLEVFWQYRDAIHGTLCSDFKYRNCCSAIALLLSCRLPIFILFRKLVSCDSAVFRKRFGMYLSRSSTLSFMSLQSRPSNVTLPEFFMSSMISVTSSSSTSFMFPSSSSNRKKPENPAIWHFSRILGQIS